MSRSTQTLKELTTGVHLVILGGFTAVRNPDGTPKVSDSGEKGIIVRFIDGFNKSFDKTFWVLGSREFEFNKMLVAAGIDKSQYKSFSEIAKAATNKRIWISIQEIHTVDGENEIGEIDYRIFDYDPCLNPEKKPTKKGDPASNPKGIASGDFLSYRQIKNSDNFGVISTSGNGYECAPRDYVVKDETKIQNQKEITGKTVLKGIQHEMLKDGASPKETEDFIEKIKEPTAKTDAILEEKIDKKEVIAKAKEMIKQVESGVKKPKSDSDTINWDDYK